MIIIIIAIRMAIKTKTPTARPGRKLLINTQDKRAGKTSGEIRCLARSSLVF